MLQLLPGKVTAERRGLLGRLGKGALSAGLFVSRILGFYKANARDRRREEAVSSPSSCHLVPEVLGKLRSPPGTHSFVQQMHSLSCRMYWGAPVARAQFQALEVTRELELKVPALWCKRKRGLKDQVSLPGTRTAGSPWEQARRHEVQDGRPFCIALQDGNRL